MSEETKHAVDEAQRAHEEAEATTHDAQDALLSAVAANLPDRVDAIARGIAERDMDTTRRLGKERLDELRAELRREALTLADQVRQAGRKLNWSGIGSSFGPSDYDVHDAVKSIFDRNARERLSSPVYDAGFGVSRQGFTADELLDAQAMKAEVDDVLRAMDAQIAASHTLTAKRKEDDDADLSDVWS